MTFNPGKLKHRVSIQREVALLDSNGDAQQNPDGSVPTEWVQIYNGEVWAAIEPLSVREFMAASATQSKLVAKMVMWYREDLDAAMRLVHVVNGSPGRIYNPEGFLADKDTGLEYLTVPVSAGVNDGQ
jgi:SPP1 family predicted phage head-tail adaptor